MSGPRLGIVAGGRPSAGQLAALGAALTTVIEEERVASTADPLPAAYRSRWRRAAMVEATEVPAGAKDGGPAWGVH